MKNQNKYFSVDETLINHLEGKQVWLLGIIDNDGKDFGLEAFFNRDENTIKSFINLYVDLGDNICSDGWPTYNYLDNSLSGYHYYLHIQGGGDFGIGVQSTSHIEVIWAQLNLN